jgi:iron complex transport system substrate-binding protein
MNSFRIAAFLSLALAPLVPLEAAEIELTDIAGRTVRIEAPVERVILGEGRYLPTLAILDRDNPARRVVGTMSDFEKLDPATYSRYVAKFPAIDDIPRLGASGANSFSVETAITTRPDVAIFGHASGHGPGAKSIEVIAQLEAAGIPVVVIDFRIDPLVNSRKSIEILGKVFSREKEAAEFLEFYSRELERVEAGVRDIAHRPSIFIESHVGLRDSCCSAMGRQVLGRFITYAGGVNAFADKIPGVIGTVSVEDILTANPDIYIGTAVGNAPFDESSGKRIVLGAGVTKEMGSASLANAVDRTGVGQLAAVREGRAYGIWHHFYNTPMNVAAVQAMAKWIHPDKFRDLDPQATFAEYFRRFQPVELDGIYWTGLGK